MKVISTIINEYYRLIGKFNEFDYLFESLVKIENQFNEYKSKDIEFENDESYLQHLNQIDSFKNQITKKANQLLVFEEEFSNFYNSFPQEGHSIIVSKGGFFKEKIYKQNNTILYSHSKSTVSQPEITILLDLARFKKLKSIIDL